MIICHQLFQDKLIKNYIIYLNEKINFINCHKISSIIFFICYNTLKTFLNISLIIETLKFVI
jgi:hypothetical protein